MKNMFKDARILFAITLIAGLALGGVYYITKEPIAEANATAEAEAYKEVFGSASSFEIVSEDVDPTSMAIASEWIANDFEGISIDKVLEAKDSSGNRLGYVISLTTPEGYGGDISFTMGITNEGILNGISILEISETAGLGMRAEDVLVPQFEDDDVDSYTVTKTGASSESQIDAISGATITSKAVTGAVNAGLFYFNNVLGGE